MTGRIPVLECLRGGKRAARRLLVLQGARELDAILDAAKAIPVEVCPREAIDRLAGGMTHQGVVLEADPLPVLELDAWLRRDWDENAVALVLDGIEDPQNFGGIIRSAAAFGAAGVLFAKDRAAPLSPAVVKAAAGGVEYVDLVRVVNVARTLRAMQDAGFWAAAFEADAPQTLWEANLRGRLALVIGGEGRGVRRLVRERCDMLLRIPIGGPISSLNASVSAAIALAECARQRWQSASS